MNIVGNSIKFTRHGHVLVSMRLEEPSEAESQPTIVLEVSDTGRGISEEYLKRNLFTQFQQEDTHVSGTGLGLSIVHHIVKELKGTIDIKSSKGVGTTVIVQFPVERLAGKPAPPPDTMGRFYDVINIDDIRERCKGLKVCFLQPWEMLNMIEDGKTREEITDEIRRYGDYLIHLATEWFGLRVTCASTWDWSSWDVFLLDESFLRMTSKSDIEEMINFMGGAAMHSIKEKPVILLGAHARLAKLHVSVVTPTSNHDHVFYLTKPAGPNQFDRVLDVCLEATVVDETRASHPSKMRRISPNRKGESLMLDIQHLAISPSSESSDYMSQAAESGAAGELKRSNGSQDDGTTKPTLLLVEDNPVNMRVGSSAWLFSNRGS